MKRFLKVLTILATVGVGEAAMADEDGGNAYGLAGCTGTPENHMVRVQKNGFFPSTLFVCPGDRVYFTNKSGYWAKFNQNWGSNSDLGRFHSYWMSNNSTKGPMQVNAGMGMRIENLDLWNVSNYTYDLQFVFGKPDLSY